MKRDKRSSRRHLHLVLLALLALAASPSHSLDVPEGGDRLGDGGAGFLSPRLQVEPSLEIYRPGARQVRDLATLSRFLRQHSDHWEVRWDRRSGRPHFLEGPGIPLLPGRGNTLIQIKDGNETHLEQVAERLREFLDASPELFRVPPEDLRLDTRRSLGFGPGKYLWLVEFQQVHEGLPVVGARIFFRINHGNIVQLGSNHLAPVELETTPSVPRELAYTLALDALGVKRGSWEILAPGRLRIYPAPTLEEQTGTAFRGAPGEGYRHLLGWEFRARAQGDQHTWRLVLDAHGGDLLQIAPLSRFAETRVSGEVFAPDPLGPDLPQEVPFPHTAVSNSGSKVTDPGGYYSYDGGEAVARLDGQYIRIEDGCGEINLTSQDGELDFGGGSSGDCATPDTGGPGNTLAARTAFYHLSRIHHLAVEYFPQDPWLATPLTVRTHLDGPSCQAFWNGQDNVLNLSRSGVGSGTFCANPGEVPAIALHEWGHAMWSHALAENESASESYAAFAEAAADTFAFLMTRDPCIADGFRPLTSCRNCGSCRGVRNLAAFAIGGISKIARPELIADDGGLDCDRFGCPFLVPGAFPPLQGPMGYGAHCESQIASSANWDLAQLLVENHGEEEGWNRMQDLWFGSLFAAGSAYRRVPSVDICSPSREAVDGCGADNWYTVYRVVDDDDGDLSNGTPNECRIWAAFDAHGIACGSQPPFCDCDQRPLADAGPDINICAGEQIVLGAPSLPNQTYSWSPSGETTAQITVSPMSTTTYTLEATTACSKKTNDKVTVFVSPCTDLGGDFETGAGSWLTSGLWHQVTEFPPCGLAAAGDSRGAMYFGQDASCDYGSGDVSRGDLISPVISGITANSYLSLDSFRDLELDPGSWDRTEMAVSVVGTDTWEVRWAMDSSDSGGGSWIAYGPFSLAPYAGQDIRLRFRFDSVDPTNNDGRGWLIDNVVVSEGNPPTANTPPRLTIDSLANDSRWQECSCIPFEGSVDDDEDGDLSAQLQWFSDIHGEFGTGRSFQKCLAPGPHTITVRLMDRGGLAATAQVEIIVTANLTNCFAILGWGPAEPQLFCSEIDR